MEIGVFDAKNRLSALIAEVARGGEVTITSRGRPVARLVPAGAAESRAKARAAADRIRARAKTVSAKTGLQTFDWPEWRGYRDEGRR